MRRLTGSRLVLATHNAGKIREVTALLAPWGLDILDADALGLPAPDETADSLLGNARLKALAASGATGLPALADDSGFSVATLNGEPGVRTADWATQPDGTRDYSRAMVEVERRAAGFADRRAWFSCALVLAWPDGQIEGFEGRIDGQWTWPPRGTLSFGFDPIFLPDGESETFSEMDQDRKAEVSHRTRAFAQLTAACLPPPPVGTVQPPRGGRR